LLLQSPLQFVGLHQRLHRLLELDLHLGLLLVEIEQHQCLKLDLLHLGLLLVEIEQHQWLKLDLLHQGLLLLLVELHPHLLLVLCLLLLMLQLLGAPISLN